MTIRIDRFEPLPTQASESNGAALVCRDLGALMVDRPQAVHFQRFTLKGKLSSVDPKPLLDLAYLVD
jgi:hypothetical protein